MIRVLIIAYTSYVRDGRVKRHAEALAQRGDEVDVICLADPQLRSGNGVNTIGIEMPRYHGRSRAAYARSYARFFARAAALAWQRSRPRRYDAAIVCSIPDAMVLCAVPLKLLGTRIILDIHDTMPELYQDKYGGGPIGAVGSRLLMAQERVSAWMADRIIAVHDLHRARLQSVGIPPHKISVVLNSPDPAIFFPQPGGRHQDDALTLVCHGTITQRLGLEVALKALTLLDSQIMVRLIVIGRGDHLDRIKAMAGAMHLQERVLFRPPVPIEQLPEQLLAADAGLIPNRPSAATHLMLPVKLMEYAALGLPVIAARLRTIEHYFDGAVRLFEGGDAAALAEAIMELRDPLIRTELARKSLDRAQRLGWINQRDAFFDAIGSVLDRDAKLMAARAGGADL